jgi:hypothetical protein
LHPVQRGCRNYLSTHPDVRVAPGLKAGASDGPLGAPWSYGFECVSRARPPAKSEASRA